MQSTFSEQTSRADQVLSAERKWAGSRSRNCESPGASALAARANRLYVMGELRLAAELLMAPNDLVRLGTA